MSIHPQVVDELRCLFKQGATTSRLIQHIARRHDCQGNCSSLAREYFWNAFGVPMLRVPDDWSVFFADDLQHSALNETVLHEILVHQTAWNHASESSSTEQQLWPDSLNATDDLEVEQQLQPTVLPELAHAWSSLDETAQKPIARLMSQAIIDSEKVTLLATLAERLQQQVNELESQLGKQPEVSTL